MSQTESNPTQTALTNGLGAAATELYVDLLKPAAVETSKNVLLAARLVTIALAPVHGVVWGMERVRDWLGEALLRRLGNHAEGDIQMPAAHICGQTLFNLQLCMEEEQLRELYANLLASAMLKDTAAKVHPAFVHVIQQITPDEALILNQIAQNGGLPIEEIRSDTFDLKGNAIAVEVQFERICVAACVAHLNMALAYLDNLLRLKVLTEVSWSEGTLKEPDPFRRTIASVDNSIGRHITVSEFGQRFIATCVRMKTSAPNSR